MTAVVRPPRSFGPTGPSGEAGPTGETGPTGATGTTWYAGAGVPDDGYGVNGDLYLNVTTGDVYEKTAGTWF